MIDLEQEAARARARGHLAFLRDGLLCIAFRTKFIVLDEEDRVLHVLPCKCKVWAHMAEVIEHSCPNAVTVSA